MSLEKATQDFDEEAAESASARPNAASENVEDFSEQQSNDSDGADAVNDLPLEGLSKNQRKKAERRRRLAEARKSKREEKKQENKAASAARRLEKKRKLDEMPEEELEAYREQTRVEREKKRKALEEQRERLKRATTDGVKLVLDFDWNHHQDAGSLTAGKEFKSLIFQLQRAYAVNVKSVAPACLILTGIAEEYKPYFDKVSGIENWKAVLRHEEAFDKVFEAQKDNLIYLTADADTTLEHVDEKDIYVIGGIVDRNRFKNATLDKAGALGIKSARLPISKYIKLKTSHVLTVNQMVEIFVSYLEARHDGKSVDECWTHAFKCVIPQRKFELEKGTSKEATKEQD